MNVQSHVRTSLVGDVHVLQILTPLLSERETVLAVEQDIQDHIKSQQATKLVLAFDLVRFLTSEMLSALMRIRDTLRELGGTIRLCSLSETVREVFRITQLDRLFPIDPDIDEAVRGLSAA